MAHQLKQLNDANHSYNKPKYDIYRSYFKPKTLLNKTSDPRSTMCKEIKKDKVTLSGKPSELKPIKAVLMSKNKTGL
ncbi:hypothetical protein [Campylobacter sputorum]|uniref:hypothetical protein n=1 Tax=Campylobacter sputorum TaxID=206 RepID=UPI00068D065F|nr:hypothetical protein [Campylobacter sputorum]